MCLDNPSHDSAAGVKLYDSIFDLDRSIMMEVKDKKLFTDIENFLSKVKQPDY